MKTIAIIPARLASVRFPEKVLIDIAGKSMIRRVYEQAQKVTLLSDIIVATDHQKVYQHVLEFGGKAMLTAENHRSGTDRCAEVVSRMNHKGLIINIQGDEPFILPQQIEQLIRFMLDRPQFTIATLKKKIEAPQTLFDPNAVKLVANRREEAIYFSRQCIPFVRDAAREEWFRHGAFYKHIGMYGYRANTLLDIAALPKGDLELRESLEQLRWLEHGYRIGVCETRSETIGIDSPEDLERVIELLRKGLLMY